MAQILAIDDSQSFLQFLEMSLLEAGHAVIACLSAASALEALRTASLDLIITDIYMPEKDGLEIISDAKRICPKVPIIAITGADGVRDHRLIARQMGALCTLQKPFSKEDLLDSVNMALMLATTK